MVLPVLPPPPDESTLWRYLDFAKFVAILSTKSLFFARADSLGDKFEGAKGASTLENKYDAFYLNWLREASRTIPNARPEDLTPEKIEKHAQQGLQSLKDAGQRARKTTFLNCWHEAEHESEAMWRLYAGWQTNSIGSNGSLAIVTDFGRLTQCLSTYANTYVGRVKYNDYRQQMVGINEAFWNKSMSLEHEHEVRAIMYHPEGSDTAGVNIPVDIHRLVIKAVISPYSPIWLESLVRDVALKYECDFVIERSSLEDLPFY